MMITSAQFVISSPDVAQCPKSTLPEYAFIGRSNVGKSSLINALCNQKNLAKTSSKPGKTLLINHFIINQQWHLVDLPGYGYAQTGLKQREQLKRMIERYCLLREQLINLFVLVDSRLKPQTIDLDFMQWLGENEIPFAIVFTKADKLSKLQLKNSIESYQTTLMDTWEQLPPIFITSAESKQGTEELTQYIEHINSTL
ncbi:MAG: YihA family ribosome biogenesis GTP-binding protein [Paludibacteraceae bacterium]|nr:YihA family ribosome biogenesis GTP-binding protein [Paludibacteraceae bacterium]